jgi:hypothetical protein
MANLPRAKDAAIRSVLFVLNRKETGSGAAPAPRKVEAA